MCIEYLEVLVKNVAKGVIRREDGAVQNLMQRDDDDAVKRVLLLFKVRVIYIYMMHK